MHIFVCCRNAASRARPADVGAAAVKGFAARILARCSCPCFAGGGVSAPLSKCISTSTGVDNVSNEVAASGKRECCTCDVVRHLIVTVSTLVCFSLVKTGKLHQPRECALTEGVVYVPIEAY